MGQCQCPKLTVVCVALQRRESTILKPTRCSADWLSGSMSMLSAPPIHTMYKVLELSHWSHAFVFNGKIWDICRKISNQSIYVNKDVQQETLEHIISRHINNIDRPLISLPLTCSALYFTTQRELNCAKIIHFLWCRQYPVAIHSFSLFTNAATLIGVAHFFYLRRPN